MAAPRNLTPMLAKLRNKLLGREYKNHLRFETLISARTQEKPWLPEGVSHKLANNYYLDRDGRRELTPPDIVYRASQNLLAAGEETPAAACKKPVTPGFSYNWDTGTPEIQ